MVVANFAEIGTRIGLSVVALLALTDCAPAVGSTVVETPTPVVSTPPTDLGITSALVESPLPLPLNRRRGMALESLNLGSFEKQLPGGDAQSATPRMSLVNLTRGMFVFNPTQMQFLSTYCGVEELDGNMIVILNPRRSAQPVNIRNTKGRIVVSIFTPNITDQIKKDLTGFDLDPDKRTQANANLANLTLNNSLIKGLCMGVDSREIGLDPENRPLLEVAEKIAAAKANRLSEEILFGTKRPMIGFINRSTTS